MNVSVALDKVWLMKSNSTTAPTITVKIAKFEKSRQNFGPVLEDGGTDRIVVPALRQG